jgi:hypothetical protein
MMTEQDLVGAIFRTALAGCDGDVNEQKATEQSSRREPDNVADEFTRERLLRSSRAGAGAHFPKARGGNYGGGQLS